MSFFISITTTTTSVATTTTSVTTTTTTSVTTTTTSVTTSIITSITATIIMTTSVTTANTTIVIRTLVPLLLPVYYYPSTQPHSISASFSVIITIHIIIIDIQIVNLPSNLYALNLYHFFYYLLSSYL